MSAPRYIPGRILTAPDEVVAWQLDVAAALTTWYAPELDYLASSITRELLRRAPRTVVPRVGGAPALPPPRALPSRRGRAPR